MTRSPIAPVEVNLVHEQVYAALKEAVMAGLYIPGQKVVVRELATRFETSPMPVREAIRRLIAQQAFEGAPNRTVRVPDFSPAKIQDLCRVRCVLEGTAAAWAAERATPALADRVAELHAAELEAFEANDLYALLQANRLLHFEVYQAAEAPCLLPCCEMLWLQLGPYLAVLRCDERLGKGLKDHGRLARALRRRDSASAQAAIVHNITIAAKDIIDNWTGGDAPKRVSRRKTRAAN